MKVMKGIKHIILILLTWSIISCVDDYQDFNPPRLKDGPFFKVSLSADTVVGGGSVNFTVSVIDAPGGIADLIVTNPQKLGSYTLDNLDAMKGNTKGEITGKFVSPTTFEGALSLMFELSDQQLDEKGEDAPKSLDVEKDLYVKFPGEATDFDVNFASDNFVRGSLVDFTIDITNSPGGVDSVFATVDQGEVILNQTSYDNIIGKENGTLTASYETDDEYVGDVTVTVNIVDKLQKRISTKAVNLEAQYEFDAPDVALSINESEFKAYNEIGLNVSISSAPGTIDTVIIQSSEVTSTGIGELIGTPTLDDGELSAAIGTASANISGTFISDTKGYILISVTVVDTEGRESSDEVEVLVLPCDEADIAGEYRAVTSGYSGDVPVGDYTDLVDTVSVSGGPGNNFDVSDLSFGLYTLQGYDPEPGSIITCDTDVVSGIGDNGLILVTSGVINNDGTIEIVWESPFGDTGTTVLTPIP